MFNKSSSPTPKKNLNKANLSHETNQQFKVVSRKIHRPKKLQGSYTPGNKKCLTTKVSIDDIKNYHHKPHHHHVHQNRILRPHTALQSVAPSDTSNDKARKEPVRVSIVVPKHDAAAKASP